MAEKIRYSQFKSLPKRIRQAFFRFCIYGALLVAGEVGFYTLTKIGRSIPLVAWLFRYDWEVDATLKLHHIWEVPVQTFFGQASLYMFIVYGAICIFGLEPAFRMMKKKDFPIILRGLVYMAIILFMECSLGWILKFVTGYDIWIYYGPGTLFTYTSWAIAPMWFVCGLVSENVISLIDSFDEMKLNVYGISATSGEGRAHKKNKIIVLSDIHIGAKNENGEPAGWFYGIYEVYLTILLFKISMDKSVRELVFLGDFFDTWLYPPEIQPESVAQIIEKWKESLFMTPLKKCIATIPSVYYIPGNHDMSVTEKDIAALTVNGQAMRILKADEYNRMHHLDCGTELVMEHGNDADFFNAPDDGSDSVQSLPFGYFVSRLVSSVEDFNIDSVFRSTYSRIIVSTFTARGDQSAEHRAGKLFIRLFVDALVAWANGSRDDGQKIGNATVIRMGEGYTDVSVAEIKTKYSSLLSSWLENRKTYMFASAGRNGLNAYARKKFGDVNRLLWLRRLFSCRGPELIVVMGHTHYSLLEHVRDREKQGVYANTGCICKNSKQSGARWVELTDTPKGCQVRLKRL
jgi:UDP-2,3-diacylglucosamine pyrophosphatase LpxH